MLVKRIKKSDVLSKLSDEEIFRKYFGEYDLNKSYNSVFREDNKPSTGFYINKNNKLIYNDFVSSEKLDCIDFVAKLYNLTIDKAINKILTDFGIQNFEELNNIEGISIERKEKRKKEYSVGYVDWTEDHLAYWKQFSITKEELEDNFVYPVNSVYVNGYCVANGDQLRFCYLINTPKQSYIKIYSPYDKEYKWMGNVPINEPFGLYDLPYKSEILIITKGNKDRIIFKKYFTDVIALQNESKDSLKIETLDYLKSRYKRIIVNFDCDKAGKHAYLHYKELGCEELTLPDFYFTQHKIKDFADLVKERGLITFERFLKYKRLI